MKAHGWAGGEVDLGEIAAVGVEDIDRAKLVEFAAAELMQTVVEVPWRHVDVFRADEIADARALVALLDLVPPTFALVLDHRGLFDEDARRAAAGAEEVKQREVGTRNRSKKLPAWKDGCFARARTDVGLKLNGLFAALDCCSSRAGAGEACIDRGEKFFGNGRFGEGKEQSVVQW